MSMYIDKVSHDFFVIINFNYSISDADLNIRKLMNFKLILKFLSLWCYKKVSEGERKGVHRLASFIFFDFRVDKYIEDTFGCTRLCCDLAPDSFKNLMSSTQNTKCGEKKGRVSNENLK